MKVAVSYWEGRVAPVFDVAQHIVLFQCPSGRGTAREKVKLNLPDPFHRAAELVNLGVQVLICGAISSPLERALAAAGVRVIGFTCGDVEKVVRAFLGGSLTRTCFRMPGWVDRKTSGGCRRRFTHKREEPAWEKTERG